MPGSESIRPTTRPRHRTQVREWRQKEKDSERDKDKDSDPDNVKQESPEPRIEKRSPNVEQRDEEPAPHTSGWTSILEDFFAHGMTVVGPSARAKDKGSQ